VKRHLIAAAGTTAAVAITTGAIFALKPFAPVLSLGSLYVLPVLVVAVAWGIAYALPASIASLLAFNWFFLPPEHTFRLRETENWFALAVYLVTSVVVSSLAAASRRRTAEAEQREREAALVADISTALLEGDDVHERLRPLSPKLAEVLHVPRARVEVDSLRHGEGDERATRLVAGGRTVGTVFTPASPAWTFSNAWSPVSRRCSRWRPSVSGSRAARSRRRPSAAAMR
jgi:K+-sensing histidine kinase KdpD